jgi:glutamate-1-semialdehyde 2,1-aminomutase
MKISINKSKKLWSQAKNLIPGGTQLLSKRPERFLPNQWPVYFDTAKGVEVTDVDGNKYIDMSLMGVGSCVLGYSDKDVDSAVQKVINKGTIATLNSPEEVFLAKELIKIHPWAHMARFARTGAEAASMAIRIARSHTKKDKVAFCGYHGWHDWYLSSNLSNKKHLDGHLLSGLAPSGVPRALANTALPFEYNNIEQLKAIIKKNDIGTIIMEPIRHQEPENNFLQEVRKIANKNNIILIFDEISSGFRHNVGGVHLKYKVNPDMAIFGKAMSNGYPMAAIIGTKKVMQSAQKSFISSTYNTERVGPTAAIATINKMKKKNTPVHIKKIGKLIEEGWIKLADKHNLKIKTQRPEALITFSFENKNSEILRTLFTQEMLAQGYLATQTVYVSFAHTPKHVKKYLISVDKVFNTIQSVIESKNPKKFLKGPTASKDFERLT